jgi:hypothetical protein
VLRLRGSRRPSRSAPGAGFAGDGIACSACKLDVTVPYASFIGSALPRGSTSTIYGTGSGEPSVENFVGDLWFLSSLCGYVCPLELPL